MNVWKLTAPKNLFREEEPNPTPSNGTVKVRVSKVLIDSADSGLYRGTLRTRYPLIPGRFALGIVAEEGAGLPKGTRLLLHTYLPRPDSGTEKRDFSEDEVLVCGQSTAGYMRDFVCLPPEHFTVLPESISDEQALLIHHIATAKATVDRFGAQKGDHVAVFGASLLGIIICQLLIYQQAAPILIDINPTRIELARKCGVYYTMLADDNLVSSVANMTGGNLSDGAVYVLNAGIGQAALPFEVCAPSSNVVYSGMYAETVNLNLALALKKQLTIYGVTGGRDYIEPAINLLIQNAVSLENFTAVYAREDKYPAFLESYDDPDRRMGEIRIVNLI